MKRRVLPMARVQNISVAFPSIKSRVKVRLDELLNPKPL